MPEIQLDLPAVSLRALTWGPTDGPLALLLHGFPDTAWTWRHLGPALAEDGWAVVAPFSRGYAPSGIARDRSGHIGALMADAVAIHQALDADRRAVVIGHDWGGITAGALAAHPNSPFCKAATLAVPPVSALQSPAALKSLPRQLGMSWYMAFNQLPLLPERNLERLARKLWADWSPGYDASEDLAHFARAVVDPAHRRAVVGYYRSLVRLARPPAQYRVWHRAWQQPPVVPTLYLHGADDGCLSPALAELVRARPPADCEVHVLPDAGHFLQLEQPETVNKLVSAFVGQPNSS